MSGGKPWCKNAVLRTLKNSVYAGFMPCGDERHEGEHEAIISKAQLDRVESIMSDMSKHGCRRARNLEYLLRGLLRCGRCGAALTTASTQKRGTVYRYYRCTTRDKRGKKICPAGQIPAEAIETFVVERIREASLGGLMSDQVHAELKRRIELQRTSLNRELKELPAQIAKLSDEGGQLAEKVCRMDDLGGRLLEGRIEKVGKQLAQAEARLAEVERSLAELNRSEILTGWVASTLGNFDAVWETMTTDNRHRLVHALVKKVELNEDTGQVTVVMTDLQLPDHEGAAAEAKSPPRPKKPRAPAATSGVQAEARP